MFDVTIPIAVRDVADCCEPWLETVGDIHGDLLAGKEVSHVLLDEFSG